MGSLTTAAESRVALSNWRDKIDTIKQTVARGATDAQLEMFITLANRYQLDPFLKEIYFVPNVGIISSRDGYLKIAQRDPQYDGITSMAVRENDEFEFDPVTPVVKHSFAQGERGKIIGAYAIVYHKQRRPVVTFADLTEYRKSSSVWTTYTSAMICKVAEVLALKRQFGISGLVTEEEIGDGHHDQKAPVASTRQRKPAGVFDAAKFREECKALRDQIKDEAYYRIIGNEGFESVEQITNREDAQRIYRLLKMEHETQQHGVSIQDAEVVNG